MGKDKRRREGMRSLCVSVSFSYKCEIWPVTKHRHLSSSTTFCANREWCAYSNAVNVLKTLHHEVKH